MSKNREREGQRSLWQPVLRGQVRGDSVSGTLLAIFPTANGAVTFRYRPDTAHAQCSPNARILNQPASTRMYSSSTLPRCSEQSGTLPPSNRYLNPEASQVSHKTRDGGQDEGRGTTDKRTRTNSVTDQIISCFKAPAV